jgi:hypothetical protein
MVYLVLIFYGLCLLLRRRSGFRLVKNNLALPLLLLLAL